MESNSLSQHHQQVPDLEQALAVMPLQTSLSSDNFKKFKPLLCPPVAELRRLSRNVILCFVCPYRVCLLLFELKIRIPSIYFYNNNSNVNPSLTLRKITASVFGSVFFRNVEVFKFLHIASVKPQNFASDLV